MRTLLVSLAAVLFIGAAVNTAQAERRMFIINNTEGYGVDRCLATGDKCGQAAANSYCKTQEFAQANSYRQIDRDDITGAIPNAKSGGCHGAKCDDFVAIVCTR